jgi:UDP-N-acetylmuramoylalanine--D-glutamate ligase
MTPASTFAGKRVALFGLGGSGLATARALVAGGASVACWDDNAASREKAATTGLEIVDLNTADWSAFASFVVSPGVPLTHPEPHWTVQRAGAAGVEIIGDIEVFFRERAAIAPSAPVVCITGTNGKSTTTALVAHILRTDGRDVQMGGNIGVNILDLASPAASRVHVIEMSSFQIDLTPSLKPTVGIVMNLTPDHLDRHGTIENYAAIKERLAAASDVAVIGVDDDYTKAMADRRTQHRGALTRFTSGGRLISGVVARAGWVTRVEGGEDFDIASIRDLPSLRGTHNAQNAAAATAAALALGVSAEVIARGLVTYASLPHRMEPLGHAGKVSFINDSKATNADSTRGALAGGDGIYWILGGKEKDGGIDDLRPLFGGVVKAYLIGHATDLFAATLEGSVPYERCGTLDVAVARAAADAAAGPHPRPTVLLSPACASYDHYKSFEYRGQHFRELVAAIPGFKSLSGVS